MNVTISIITINYNNSKLTYDFLISLDQYFPKSSFSFEVIVIDNASTTASYLELQEYLDNVHFNVKLHRSNINLGFGGGNMLGNQFANGDYIAFINNDVIFIEDCFSSLVDFMSQNKKVGVCSPQQINNFDKPEIGFDYFQGIRKELFGRSFIEKTSNRNVKRKDLPYKNVFAVDAIQGCFMFFNKQAFSSIGGFDTNLFLYFEEMDICSRLLKKGYSSYLLPQTKFKHLVGATIGKSLLMKKELLISRMYIYRKKYGFLKYKILQSIICVKLFFKTILKPRYFSFFLIVFRGNYLNYSLKQNQKISYLK